jgi:putative Mg2+ transporter-C (MgtC) family protein
MNTMLAFLDEPGDLNICSVAFRILLAVAFGGCVGMERGWHGRAAGLRTHILVCVGATMAALVGVFSIRYLNPNSDPLRTGAQVISGMGFLGAGTILVRDRTRVTGLTTAAGLWATASIGLAIGIGFYTAAFFAFLAIFITMTILIWVERMTRSKHSYLCYIECSNSGFFQDFYRQVKPLVSNIEIIPAKSGISGHVGIEFKADNRDNYHQLLEKAEENEHVVIALPLQNN